MDWYAQLAEKYCLEYLQDPGNYPIIDGEVAFYDIETYNEHSAIGIPRPSSNLIDEWIVHFDVTPENKIHWIVENTKYVGRFGQYNLLDLLEKGNSAVTYSYDDRSFLQKTRMSFYNRYRTRWFWKMTHRDAMRPIFKKEIKKLVNAAVDYGLEMAEEEARETIGWGA
jgi:hypothetical protein